ncbi:MULTISPECIES: PP2C family protein-serine/threonine phosphatase [Methanobacterium]|uniref:PP2C family protein-serine/threonine phosphatase n=1 Tax=Methanobacterium veterum TaxID=408577 RepID=A0A9E4ZZ84_9EURY|nr:MULTISPECIES: PP2C family protein-serine/threonine phosphatase [Methanobacterium]MCZ3365280.1 PP2C family protein-serine/threonine phosphatase [Methanobacterium veterum]MCZ3373031.1 PP2C family protein-serine/threonine phosphatase [Methanobacterium veterum]
MKNLENIKSKVILLALCSAVIFIMKFIFHYFFPGIPISELGPASALPPVLGLMFGVWGAAGVAIGYSVSELAAGSSPEIYGISFFIQFLYAYIPYKLWYTLNWDETTTLPRLDTVKHLVKFVVIMFINAAVMAGLLGFLMDGLGLYDLVSLTTLIFAVNNFDFSIMFGTLILIGANFYGISMYKPKKVKKTRVPPKIFDLIAVLVVVISIGNGIYSAFTDPNIWGWIAGVITYSLVLIYVFRPITSEIRERATEIKMSLTENLIVIFIIMGAIIAILTGIRSLFIVSAMTNLQFWDSVYLNITLILSVFYIASIAFLWYIERNISTPIESISDIVKNYVSDSGGIRNNDAIISKCEQYTAQKSEVGILAASFQKMAMDLEIYVKNLKSVTAEKERINTELNVAKKIQEDMLPRKFPAFPERNEFDVYAMNIPAKEVGGDFYDFFLIDEGHLAIVIADVSGKGVPAALFMVVAKTLIKNHAQLGKSPAEVFTAVNNQLCEGNDENMFVTAWMGILEIETGKFTYVNAGHNPPLLKHAGKNYVWLKSKPGFVLAGMEDINYHQNAIALEPGDRVYLYTDGVTEASNINDELFGDSRLLQIMNDKKDIGLKELVSYVKEKVDVFAGEREQFDDITMLVMEYKK